MCGRYFLSNPGDVIAESFELAEAPELEPRYNISPGQEAPVVRTVSDHSFPPRRLRRRLDWMQWGFAPSRSGGRYLINARSETVTEKVCFRTAFELRRCLIPATGFYEWRKNGPLRAPYVIRRSDRELFAMAGVWRDRFDDTSHGPRSSYVILTTNANDAVSGIHDRMPVILRSPDFEAWLDPENTKLEKLTAMLCPLPAELMTTYPVSSFVNSAGNEGEQCVERVEEAPRQQTLF